MKRLITLLLPLLSILLVIVIGEGLFRLYHLVRWDVSMIDGKPRHPERAGNRGLSPITLDDKLGWRATENYRLQEIHHSSDGSDYPLNFSQDNRGFRMFGNVSSGKRRMFVLGDSFTQAQDASDGKAYYAMLGQDLNIEVFAYGVGGYGSLQEYMILDRYFDEIHPDLILWQFSANDIINNSPVLETASRANNNGMTRPYWVANHIEYILPTNDSAGLRRFAVQYCRLCYMTLNRLDKLRAATQNTVETETAVGKLFHPQFLDAVRVTDTIIKKVKARIGSLPFFAFIIGDPGKVEYWEALEDICRQNGIILLSDVNASVERAEQKGVAVRGPDSTHWNEVGHRIAADTIEASMHQASSALQ